jgi:hypothetical protein
MKVAFYKGKGDWTDKLIRWFTSSKYSHVEIVHNDGTWYTSSARDGGVVKRRIRLNPDHWDIVEIDISESRLLALYDKTKGEKYDYLGILLSQIIPMHIQDKHKWFCSEWCSKVLGAKYPETFSPEDVYMYVKNLS